MTKYLYLFWLPVCFFVMVPTFAQQINEPAKSKAKPKKSTEERMRHHQLNLGFVFSIGPAADTVYSSLYKLPILLGGNFGYVYENAFMQHIVALQGAAGWLVSPYKAAGKVFGESYEPKVDLPIEAQLQYNVSFTLWSNPYLRFRLGPGIHFFSDLWLVNDPDLFRYAWFVNTGLGLKLFLSFQPNLKHKLSFGFYMPIINVGWRSPYVGYTLKEEKLLETQGILSPIFAMPVFLSFHNMIDVNLQVSYQYRLFRFMSLLVDYQSKILYTIAIRRRLELQSYVSLGVSFYF